jgi:hypothetical protein
MLISSSVKKQKQKQKQEIEWLRKNNKFNLFYEIIHLVYLMLTTKDDYYKRLHKANLLSLINKI